MGMRVIPAQAPGGRRYPLGRGSPEPVPEALPEALVGLEGLGELPQVLASLDQPPVQLLRKGLQPDTATVALNRLLGLPAPFQVIPELA